MYQENRRAYQRGLHFHIDAKISTDGIIWTEAFISDLSSGGLQLHSDTCYQKDDILWFDLMIQGFFTEFEVKVKGIVRREHMREKQHIYGISFLDLSPELKIRIDENVMNDRPVGGASYLSD